ncbi:MAG: aminotransferase class I/II-fold pyridoxal phosphate-dependent enzyme [Synergistaceae bacterium]|nr:aminotransferase class I/II-fold pyridoxal phosphate-dependent enzyme [Synergistaceae bacterium]
MKIRDFQLERYFAKYEFNVKHLLSPSDCETRPVGEILGLPGGEWRERLNSLPLSYTESRGNPGIIGALDAIYGVGNDGIVVGCPEELIFLFMNSFLDAGDRVVCLSPAYQSLYELPRSIGCEVVLWKLTASGGRWSLDRDELKPLLKDRTKLLVVNFPHNPTGYMPTPEEFDMIGDLAEGSGAVVFSDEMYRGLELDAPRLPSFCGRENAVIMSGLSKGPGLPGLRTGWLASKRHGLISSVLAMKDYTTICNSGPGEVLAEAAIRNIDELMERNRTILRANAELAGKFFAGRPDLIEWIPPAGGTTAFPRLLDGNIEDLCRRAVGEKSLMVLPDSVFDAKDNRFRVGMGRLNFPEALGLFGELLEG